jgi:hypothetical protein
MNKIEVEDGELLLKNSHGDLVVVPKNKASWVRNKIAEGCHNCIDEMASSIPLLSQYAENGTLIPNDTDPPIKKPYISDFSEFNQVNGKYVPKDELEFRKRLGLKENEAFAPIPSYNIRPQPMVKTQPIVPTTRYGLGGEYFPIKMGSFGPLERIADEDKRANWLKAYSELKEPENIRKSYSSSQVFKGYEIQATPYTNDFGQRRLEATPVYSEVLSPLAQRIQDYKNSDTFIERLAASHYANQLDINQWMSNPSYREGITKKYIQENPELSKKIISYIRDLDSQTNIGISGQGSSDSSGIKKIEINPIFHKRNFKNEQEHYEAALKYVKENMPNAPAEAVAKNIVSMQSLDDTDTAQVLSHEAGHHFFDKESLVKDRGLSEEQVYPENKLIWDLNQTTQKGRKNFDEFKNLLGYAQYKGDKTYDDRELTHEESPEEIKADIASLRDYLYSQYEFDHINQMFDENIFNKIMNDKNWTSSLIGKRLLSRFGTDKTTWYKLMNLIAGVNSQNFNTTG